MSVSVLVVDDNPDDRRIVMRHLRRDPVNLYAIREASSGDAAIAQMRELTPDVVVLDHHLGAMTGIDVLTTIRRDMPAEIAVVYLTGSAEAADHDPFELGADDYLNKEEIAGHHLRRAIRNGIAKARIRAQLQQSKHELSDAFAELKRRMNFERKLLGVVGHDLRSPLSAIALGVEALQETVGDGPVARSTLAAIRRSTTHMTNMVEQLLDATRFKTDEGFSVRVEPLDVEAVAKDRIDEVRATHPERAIDLDVSGNMRGMFDPTALGQLFHNLVNNAIQYGDPAQPVVVRLRGDEAQIRIEVENQGETIAPERLASIFDAFERGNHRRRGLGLGLYITREIAMAHEGSLAVTSEDGVTRFSVDLPIGPAGLG